MPLEIERRFLVREHFVPSISNLEVYNIKQGYLTYPEDSLVLRVRQVNNGSGFLTIKKQVSAGINKEFEYRISETEVTELLKECSGLVIHKNRYHYPVPGTDFIYEIDEFLDEFAGIMIAEIELPSLDTPVVIPKFVEREITDAKGISNFAMAFNPDAVKNYLRHR
jgi:adenylate cyclase